MNELKDWIIYENNGCRKQTHTNIESYSYINLVSTQNKSHNNIINIDSSIVVKANDELLSILNNEPTSTSWIQKSFTITISSSGSRALLINSSLMFYPEEDFSSIFRHFTTSFTNDPNNKEKAESSHIYNYFDVFVKHETYQPINFAEIERPCEGFLHLELATNNNTGHHLDTFKIEQIHLYILSGTYISPFAKDLVQDPLVNGIQLDTTWGILKNYFTSIPTLIVQNVRIPIGFQFGLHENTSIYWFFFDYFENIFGFKTKDYIFLIILKIFLVFKTKDYI